MTLTSCVDVHAHAVNGRLLTDLANGRARFPHVQVASAESSYTVAFSDGPPTRPIAAGLIDIDRRLAWMDERRVDRQIVAGWLDIFGYELPADEGADWAALVTESLVDLARTSERLEPLATVPMQDPARAAAALARHFKAGVVGAMISTRPGGRELDDPELIPFWEQADDLGSVIYLHPGYGSPSPRYEDLGLVNGLARIEDSTVAVARALLTGLPDRFPRVKFVVSHGGGAVPYVLGRLRRNHAVNPQTTIDPMPSFARLYFDSVVFERAALEFLISVTEPGHILLGSDYPFPIGDPTPLEVVEQADVDETTRRSILGDAAVELFRADAR
jgi:aminocarboxymuconate-semialdehyde decarboxylase